MAILDIQFVFFLIFLAILTLFAHFKKKNFTMQKIAYPFLYFSMYRTKLGLKFMDSAATKYRRIFTFLTGAILIITGIYFNAIFPTEYSSSVITYIMIATRIAVLLSGIIIMIFPQFFDYVIIFFGFFGMAIIIATLSWSFLGMIMKKEAATGVQLVLPIKGKGIFHIPFLYWIASIMIIVVVHEFAHGLLARMHKIKVKSSGFAFVSVLIPVIPLAFVEPDEKTLSKKSLKQQLSVFAAGPFSNIIATFVFAFIILGLSSASSHFIEADGVKIVDYTKGNNTIYPAEKTGLKGLTINKLDGKEILYLQNLSDALEEKNPGERVRLETDNGTYSMVLAKDPNNSSRAFMGISPEQKIKIKGNSGIFSRAMAQVLSWLATLFGFLTLLNLGIGLFNLIPSGPLDGGRMANSVIKRFFEKEKGAKIFGFISLLFFVIIVASILFSFFK